jgi:phage FluMu gp28-like protein
LYEQISKVSKKPLPPKDEWVAGVFADYGDSADEELRCIPARGGEAYFTQILMDGVMQTGIPVLRFRAPADNFVDWAKAQRDAVTDKWCRDNLDAPITACNKNFRHFAGVDAAGRTGDLATFWLLEELKNLELATMCVVEFEHLPYSEVERTLEYIFKAIPASVAFDATGNGQQLAERARQKYGASRVLEQKINDSYYTEAMPLAKRYIEDRTVTIPKDAGILSDFRQVKVMNGIPKFPAVKNVVSGTQRHGDAASAYVLAIWARQQLGDLGEPYYESLIKREKYFGKLAY